MTELTTFTWSLDQLGEALSGLAKASKLTAQVISLPRPPAEMESVPDNLERWIETAVSPYGIEAEPTRIAYKDLTTFLRTAGPAIFKLEQAKTVRFLALVKVRGRRAFILAPNQRIRRLPIVEVRSLLSSSLESPYLPDINQLLEDTAVPKRKKAKARSFILEGQMATSAIDGCWLLDLSPGSRFVDQLRRTGVLRRAVQFIITYILQHFLFLTAWWVIGRAVFQGRIEFSWLVAWALILLSLLPLQMLNTWLQGIIAVTMGGLLQKRLLFGALRLHPDEIRHEGAGQLMGRVFEGEAIETLSLNGGIRGLTALIELVMAGWVLALGAGGILHALLLLIWLAIIGGILVRFYHRRHKWTLQRRDLTHYLVEVMVGHRTRLAQTLRQDWHRGEDEDLAEYIKVLDEVDRTAIALEAFISHGWLVIGLAGLIPAFVWGSSTPATLAISLGGVLSAELAFRKFALGLVNQLLAAIIAWDQIGPLFKAANRTESQGSPDVGIVAREDESKTTTALLDAHDINYRYKEGRKLVLENCDLRIQTGDRILLEGPSGSGKSTLAAVLTGMREPDSGLLLWRGVDRATIGKSWWGKRVVFAPQFHENYVVGSTFLFNLLMGKRWPPRPTEIQHAQMLCAELGLQDVLERMPAGILQTVGETGWQLSHGEKSRLFIARALLQGVDLIILDESFAALDPQNLLRAMKTVQERAKTLMVIAHP